MTEALLVVQSLTKRFGGLRAVADVSLEVHRDDLLCLIGPNGAGKSTLLNMLTGTLRPDSGAIRFEGRPVAGLALHRMARLGISRKFQVPSVFERMTVRECLEVARLAPRSGVSPLSVDEVLSLMEFTQLAERSVSELAHGQKQWLEIGMALAVGPKLLLLDEPTAGMTRRETLRTAELLKTLACHSAMVVVEHDMRFVRALDRYVIVLHQGAILAAGSYDAIQRDERVRDVYLGRA
jgi:urea ABC transporter ATP-binding protein UrtD